MEAQCPERFIRNGEEDASGGGRTPFDTRNERRVVTGEASAPEILCVMLRGKHGEIPSESTGANGSTIQAASASLLGPELSSTSAVSRITWR
jgi:hypothetical protein